MILRFHRWVVELQAKLKRMYHLLKGGWRVVVGSQVVGSWGGDVMIIPWWWWWWWWLYCILLQMWMIYEDWHFGCCYWSDLASSIRFEETHVLTPLLCWAWLSLPHCHWFTRFFWRPTSYDSTSESAWFCLHPLIGTRLSSSEIFVPRLSEYMMHHGYRWNTQFHSQCDFLSQTPIWPANFDI